MLVTLSCRGLRPSARGRTYRILVKPDTRDIFISCPSGNRDPRRQPPAWPGRTQPRKRRSTMRAALSRRCPPARKRELAGRCPLARLGAARHRRRTGAAFRLSGRRWRSPQRDCFVPEAVVCPDPAHVIAPRRNQLRAHAVSDYCLSVLGAACSRASSGSIAMWWCVPGWIGSFRPRGRGALSFPRQAARPT